MSSPFPKILSADGDADARVRNPWDESEPTDGGCVGLAVVPVLVGYTYSDTNFTTINGIVMRLAATKRPDVFVQFVVPRWYFERVTDPAWPVFNSYPLSYMGHVSLSFPWCSAVLADSRESALREHLESSKLPVVQFADVLEWDVENTDQ